MTTSLAVALVLAAPSPYAIDPPLDLALTLGSLGTLVVMHTAARPNLARDYTCTPLAPAQLCDRDRLTWLDRGTVGNDSRAWRDVSDWVLAGGLTAAATSAVLDHALEDDAMAWGEAASDVLVISEAVATAALTAHVLRYAIRRPRPTQYVRDAEIEDTERHLSFPSAHTTTAAAAASAYATTFWLRHPESAWRWGVLAAGTTFATLVAVGRVQGGRHFPSDVIGGALVGTTFGLAVPLAHRAELALTVAAGDTKALLVSGSW